MANPVLAHKKNGRYLWFSLLGLGLHPDTAVAGKTSNTKHINLGPNMFDKPNKDAFYIVAQFLLERLNPTRFKEAYRYCWPVVSHKADAEFRKVTCVWLREIMDETANAGSKVLASLFLSPGGPKFTSLMLHLAKYVMLHEMKSFTTDDSWVPEAAATPTSSLDMAAKRLNLIHARFLKVAVAQDRFLHDYQRRAQLLVKSMRDIRAEGAKYDELLKRHSSDSTQEGVSLEEKIKKVRSLWSDIDGMLSATKEEQLVVESVLKGDVDQYVLDGTDRVLNIPRRLLDRIEQLPHQLSSGNVYESGQLNLLCVFELMNHALQLLREERRRVSHAPKLQLSPPQLQEKCQQMARALQNLHLIRLRISKEEIPEVRSAIRELEVAWDRKWHDTLKDTPLVSFLNEDPKVAPMRTNTRDRSANILDMEFLDVKTSWRKAVEEDEAEKTMRLSKIDESLKGFLTPLDEQQASLKSTMLWDTFNTEAFDCRSGTGSSALLYSLDHETLPEMPSCDSLLSLDDEAEDTRSDVDEELLIPSLKTETPLTTRHRLAQVQQECGNGSFMETRTPPPKCLNQKPRDWTGDRDWQVEPSKSVGAADEVFSLDLDTLGTPSPPKKQEYSLPKLITFSPMDDMKC
ncbi:HAUS augmin-like complex subunit 6 [Liparis tanakae]|uniref:HAUS augmin-like complex subunit 6 n=1 Tax=Liparis tanakae TaxID=230148 RepID=A0A4Z2J163_9TELE|nr:HAUS augmin-like complex subunit 6 [Liparis tanakae]